MKLNFDSVEIGFILKIKKNIIWGSACISDWEKGKTYCKVFPRLRQHFQYAVRGKVKKKQRKINYPKALN